MKEIEIRLAEEDLTLSLSKAATEFLVEKGYDEKFGARPLRRAIQRYLEDELSEKILLAEFTAGDEIVVDVNEDGQRTHDSCRLSDEDLRSGTGLVSCYISSTTTLLTSFVAVVLICTKPSVVSAQVEPQAVGGPIGIDSITVVGNVRQSDMAIILLSQLSGDGAYTIFDIQEGDQDSVGDRSIP